MITYVDSSVLLARYLVEERSHDASALIGASTFVATSRVTDIEVRRGLSFIDSAMERTTSQFQFAQDWRSLAIVECDSALADLAATIAADTGVRSLDAIHVASALVAGTERFLTFDQRQARAARTFNLTVMGVPKGPQSPRPLLSGE